MGREVRHVPADWQHPKDAGGNLLPLHERFCYNAEEIKEGLRDGWLDDEPPNYGVGVMPDWPKSERTHIQMYETTSEGTPLSPVMKTPEELARWLADNNASAFGAKYATQEQWLSRINGELERTNGLKEDEDMNIDIKDIDEEDDHIREIVNLLDKSPRNKQLEVIRFMISKFSITEDELLGPCVVPGPTGRIR